VRSFKIDRVAQLEFDEAAGWYEQQRVGLGFEFIEEVDRVLARIETHEKFVTTPLAVLESGSFGGSSCSSLLLPPVHRPRGSHVAARICTFA
jgi:hypothetical protein